MIARHSQDDVRRARRAALAPHPTQIGIDFVTVDPVRRSLTLHFVPVASGSTKANTLQTIARENIRFIGGRDARPTNLRVIAVNADVSANRLLVTYELESDPMRMSDFDDYVLRIVDVPAVDPFFDRIAFSLRLDEPVAFDPVSAPRPTVAPEPDEDIDYLARDYGSLRRLMLDRLSLRMPRWRDHHPADVGVAIVELLAYAADQLSYYQDAVATEAYLGTARRRTSVRRHARLLDYAMHEGCNARAWVQVRVDGDAVELPHGTALVTRCAPDVRLGSASRALPQPLPAGTQWFETVQTAVLSSAHNEIRVYTWGASDYVLPVGAVTATLRDALVDPANAASGRRLDRLQAGQALIVEEIRDPRTGETADADLSHRHAVRLIRVTRGFDRLGELRPPPANAPAPTSDGTPIVEVEWHRDDALPFPVAIARQRGDRATENVSVFRGNVVLADHGRTLEAEPLPDVPASGRYRPALARGPITFSVADDLAAASTQSAAVALVQNPRAAVPQLVVIETPASADAGPVAASTAVRWSPVRDLLRSGRFSNELVVETEGDGRATLRFGDGTRGRRPHVGHLYTARYRIGSGVDGNVGPEAIAHVVSDDVRLVGVRNPLPAQGGTEPEPIEQVRLHAPAAFKAQERCVTEADYAAMAERHPAVQQAAAVLRWTGSWHTAFVTVRRHGGQLVDDAFRTEVAAFLASATPAGCDVEVCAPRHVSCDIRLVVHLADSHFRSTARQVLRGVFSSATLGDGRSGFFHPERFGFGQPLYLSPIVATAMSLPGVVRADVTRFQRWGRPDRGERAVGRIDVGPLEIVRVESDPAAPENGLIAFEVEGGH